MLAGPGRPFHFAGVADKLGRVAVSFECPSNSYLAALLTYRTKFKEWCAGGEAGLLLNSR